MNIKRWEGYKELFQITIFKYLVMWFSIVPILAGLAKAIPAHLLTIGNEKLIVNVAAISLSLPFNWELLWLSSLFFVIALLIYWLRCPAFVMKYNSFTDYKQYSHDQRWMAWLASDFITSASAAEMDTFVSRLSVKKFLIDEVGEDKNLDTPQVEETQTVRYFQHAGKKYGLGMPIKLDNMPQEDSEKGIFYELFGRYSESRFYSRLTIFICLLISAVLFGVVLIQHISAGAVYFIEWAKG